MRRLKPNAEQIRDIAKSNSISLIEAERIAIRRNLHRAINTIEGVSPDLRNILKVLASL